MTPHPRTRPRACSWPQLLLLWGALALLRGLDASPVAEVQTAAVFAAIIAVLNVIWDVVQTVGTVIAIGLQAAVGWLLSMVGWLASHLGAQLMGVGKMFAKIWEHKFLLWEKVLRPAFAFIDRWLLRLFEWLDTTIGPVLRFLKRALDAVDRIYTQYLRPFRDLVDFVHLLNRALETLHVRVLSGLDRHLTAINAWLEAQFLEVRGRIRQAEHWIDRIITLDGYLQRATLLQSLQRYAPDWTRLFWRLQVEGISKAEEARRKAQTVPKVDPAAPGEALAAYRTTGSGPYAAPIGELLPVYQRAAGTAGAPAGPAEPA